MSIARGVLSGHAILAGGNLFMAFSFGMDGHRRHLVVPPRHQRYDFEGTVLNQVLYFRFIVFIG